jgi:hypothetical protein
MSTVFKTNDTLRTQYDEIAFGELAASNVGSEVLLFITSGTSKMLSITNDTNTEIAVSLENDSDPAHTRIPFLKLGPCQAFNIDAVSGGILNFPVACRVWVHTEGLSPTSGKVRGFLWG